MAHHEHTWICEACGERLVLFRKANAVTHALCPRREPRKALPAYKEVADGVREHATSTEVTK